MATLEDIGVSALINVISVVAFLLAFALLRIQPINDRVYFPKWHINGGRKSPKISRSAVGKFVNLDFRTYLTTTLSWMPQALAMSEKEIIQHAGLDSAVYLRIYLLGLKIFVPITVLAILVLIPVNAYGGTLLRLRKDLIFSSIDKLSISNVSPGSQRFWVHLGMAYAFTIWTCYMLYLEYDKVASMRLKFLASKHCHADQFTRMTESIESGNEQSRDVSLVSVGWIIKLLSLYITALATPMRMKVVVQNIPSPSGHSISESVDRFFQTNHPNHYLGHQGIYNAKKFAKLVRKKGQLQNRLLYYQLKFERHPNKRPTIKSGFLGLCGPTVDSIDFYKDKINEIEKKIASERQRVLNDPKATMPAAFVSFNSRWAAAICAQTQQSKNPTLWLTNWAPEPHDIYWKNLSIPFFSLSIRRLVVALSVFTLVFFYMIPIAFVQSLANLEGLEKVAPFLRPVIERKVVKSFLQSFLPGLVLNVFLYILPSVLMIMSKIEGYLSLSALERKTAAKYYYFMLVNVFLGSIVTGTAFEQLYSFLHQPPTEIPRTIGVSIPMKATFFITYIMVDGWAGIAGEILQLKALVIFHLKNMFLVKNKRDLEKAMDLGSVKHKKNLPTLELYFLLGLVYAVITPVLLPFILTYFGFAFLVYRHQIINVYNQNYESDAAFWPHVHGRIISSVLISHLLLLGLLNTKKAAYSTPLLLVLPVLTIWFHMYCKSRFEPGFRKYPLEEAMAKDIMERNAEPELDLRDHLADAYLHPIFHLADALEAGEVIIDKQTYLATPIESEISTQSPPHNEVEL